MTSPITLISVPLASIFVFYNLRLVIFALFPLAPCKSILNAFVYEIYQRVFILFELSVKHTLSDFLLPFRCHKYTINLLINQDLIWATKVSFIFLFKSLIFLNWETFISLTITSCNLSGMSAETNSRYLAII